MTAVHRRSWTLIVLGTLSLAVGYTWGRFRPRAPETSKSAPVEASEVVAGSERQQEVLEPGEEVTPAAVDTAAAGSETPTAAIATPPLHAHLDEVAALVESFANASPEDIARFPWDHRVRGALEKLRSASGDSHTADSLPPSTLATLLAGLLERANLPLTTAQHEALEQLAADWKEQIDRELAGLGDEVLAIERELAVVMLTDGFLEDVVALLDDRQVIQLDSWTPQTLEWPPFLSPLAHAQIARRELRREEIPEFRDALSRSLNREFGVDPEDGDRYAASFLADIEPLLARPAHRDEIVERSVELGAATARLFRQLLAHPALDAAARSRIQTRRHWMAPVLVTE